MDEKPSRARVEGPARRKSCSTQSVTPDSLSSRALIFEKPEIGVLPVVVNTKSCPSIRVTAPRASRAASVSVTTCACPRFMRWAGMVHTLRSGDTSDQRIPATSSRRASVNSASRTKGPAGSGMSHAAFQTAPISSSVSSLSRAIAAAPAGRPWNGFAGRVPRFTAQA